MADDARRRSSRTLFPIPPTPPSLPPSSSINLLPDSIQNSRCS
ncbi:hypothetical protein CASFOL_023997 [Castilleja foliolosa]|uniref:Uncharacterized protein n=1 Tax=Castilleja foliolosa TaxID=1961234 RepID=A0ABD3CM20_9LAMI